MQQNDHKINFERVGAKLMAFTLGLLVSGATSFSVFYMEFLNVTQEIKHTRESVDSVKRLFETNIDYLDQRIQQNERRLDQIENQMREE